jgi:hypothetical protein
VQKLATDDTLARIAPWAFAGFALTTAWMPLFSMGQFWLCLAVIVAATVCMTRCAMILSHDRTPQQGQWLWAWAPLSLHAGWLTLASFLNPYRNDGDPFDSPFVGSFDADPGTPGNQIVQRRSVGFSEIMSSAGSPWGNMHANKPRLALVEAGKRFFYLYLCFA